jgi:hypothetical protein
MPTKKYKDLDEAYQALTDIEIMDDEQDMPCAIIPTKGLGKITITMVNEYDYWYTLMPMRDTFINYYVNRYYVEKKEHNKEKLIERINLFVAEMTNTKTKEEVNNKANDIMWLFKDINIRYEFFKGIRKMRVIPWYVTWKKYQKSVRPIDTCLIFCYLWLFNFDGLKKKLLNLLKKMNITFQDTNSPSLTVLSNSFNLDTYKKKLQEGTERANQKLGIIPINSNN